MASRPTQVSVGSVVNPLEQAGKLFTDYMDKQQRAAVQAEEQRRWETSNTRAEEVAQQRRDALAADAKQKEALRTYDPRFGELGGRGIQARALEDYSGKAGTDVESILSRYNVGAGEGQTSIGAMEAPQRELLSKELSGLGGAIGSELKAFAPSKSEAEELIRSDLIRAGVDSGVAYDEATKRTKNLLSRKDVEAAEKSATDEANKALKVKKDNLKSILKYDVDSDKNTVKAKKVNSPDELYKYIGESGVGPLDKNQAIKAVQAALKVKDVTPTRVMQALQQLKEPEKYGLEGLFTGREFQSTDTPAEFLKYVAENTTEPSASGRRELNAVERAILNAPHLATSSYGDIMAKAGKEAYKDKNLGGEAVATPTTTSPQNPAGGGQGGRQSTRGVGSQEVFSEGGVAGWDTLSNIANESIESRRANAIADATPDYKNTLEEFLMEAPSGDTSSVKSTQRSSRQKNTGSAKAFERDVMRGFADFNKLGQEYIGAPAKEAADLVMRRYNESITDPLKRYMYKEVPDERNLKGKNLLATKPTVVNSEEYNQEPYSNTFTDRLINKVGKQAGNAVDWLEFNVRPEDNPNVGRLENIEFGKKYIPYVPPKAATSEEMQRDYDPTVAGIMDYVGTNEGLAKQVVKEALNSGDRKLQDQVMQALAPKHTELVKDKFKNFYDTSVSELGATAQQQAEAIAERLDIPLIEAYGMVMEELRKQYK